TFTPAEFGLTSYVLIPLITTLVSFGLFWIIVERFINNKIKVIYRIISDKKITQNNPREFKITEDVLGGLTRDTAEWAEQQAKKIKELKEQALFRKEFLGNLAHELKTPV